MHILSSLFRSFRRCGSRHQTNKYNIHSLTVQICIWYLCYNTLRKMPRTSFVPPSFYLVSWGGCTPGEIIRKLVVVKLALHGRSDPPPSYSRVAMLKAVLTYQLLVEPCGCFWCSWSRWVTKIDVMNPEAFRVSSSPLKVIHHWPCRVSLYIALIQFYSYQ